jgi:hypothetical protein
MLGFDMHHNRACVLLRTNWLQIYIGFVGIEKTNYMKLKRTDPAFEMGMKIACINGEQR